MPKKKPAKKPAAPRYETVAMDTLMLDPRNARVHDEGNIAAIAASLRKFGQVRPIVVNSRNRQIVAGNGTFQAAELLGWSQIDVSWQDLSQKQQNALGIADNRSAELATWDDPLLAELVDEILEADEADEADEFADMFQALLIDELLEEPDEPPAGEGGEGGGQVVPDQWQIVVECTDEADQKALYKKLEKEGRRCRLLTL